MLPGAAGSFAHFCLRPTRCPTRSVVRGQPNSKPEDHWRPNETSATTASFTAQSVRYRRSYRLEFAALRHYLLTSRSADPPSCFGPIDSTPPPMLSVTIEARRTLPRRASFTLMHGIRLAIRCPLQDGSGRGLPGSPADPRRPRSTAASTNGPGAAAPFDTPETAATSTTKAIPGAASANVPHTEAPILACPRRDAHPLLRSSEVIPNTSDGIRQSGRYKRDQQKQPN